MVLSFLGQDIIDLRLFLNIQLSTLQLSQASAGLPDFDKSFLEKLLVSLVESQFLPTVVFPSGQRLGTLLY